MVFALLAVEVHQTIGAILIVFSALCLCGTSFFKIVQLFILSVLRTGLNIILRWKHFIERPKTRCKYWVVAIDLIDFLLLPLRYCWIFEIIGNRRCLKHSHRSNDRLTFGYLNFSINCTKSHLNASCRSLRRNKSSSINLLNLWVVTGDLILTSRFATLYFHSLCAFYHWTLMWL